MFALLFVLAGCEGTCDGPNRPGAHRVDENWVKAGRLLDDANRFQRELCACADAVCAAPLERDRLAFEQLHQLVIASPNTNATAVRGMLRAGEDCALRLLGKGSD